MGPDHWQSHWASRYGYKIVQQHDWIKPLRGDWVSRLEETLLERSARQPLLLVGHGLGCILATAWATLTRHAHLVQGALLVAPTDTEQPRAGGMLVRWPPIGLQRLPFPSVVVASRDDPCCSMARAQFFAKAWGSALVDHGMSGHIDSDSRLGGWDEGHRMLLALGLPQTIS